MASPLIKVSTLQTSKSLHFSYYYCHKNPQNIKKMFSSERRKSETKPSSEFKNTPIKLFGMTISSPNYSKVSSTDFSDSSKPTCSSSSIHQSHFSDEQKPSPDRNHIEPENVLCENPKTPSADKEVSTYESPMNEDQSDTSNNTEETALKKPDKIIPCPRCYSMDTKFCYYNNYNVHQPRHFCKKCQRYWTAGGSMRNVPVGAGRRKNKPSSVTHYQQILVSEAAHNLQPLSMVRNNGTVLNCASDAPFCKSMASNSNIAERKLNYFSNGVHEVNDYRDDRLCNSNMTVSNSNGNGVHNSGFPQNFQGYPQPACFAPWLPAFYPPGFQASVSQSPSCWGCTFPGSQDVPWSSQNNSHSSQTLGKHSRDGDILNSSCNSEKQEEVLNEKKSSQRVVWIPKTLRIDDPSEAAKSSIWATLGIKNGKNSCSKKVEGLFTSFRSTGDDGQDVNHVTDALLPVLHANPAATSRSLDFNEAT